MKNKLTLLFSIISLLFLLSCDKELPRTDNFLVEFATVKMVNSSISFELDNENILEPENPTSLDLVNGNRVILNYTPLENGLITINSVRKIFLDTIKEDGFPGEVKTSPIKIISIWVSGNYLNMSFEVDYHSKSHNTAMYRDIDAAETTLYFSYSRGDDPPGAPILNYLSFDLKSLEKKSSFTVYVNSYEGIREFEFQID